MSSSKKRNSRYSQSQSDSQGEEVVEVAIKKQPEIIRKMQQPRPPIKKIQKKQKSPKISSSLKKLLQQRIQDQKILKQLERAPLTLGQQMVNNKKILLVQQNIKVSKKDKTLGLNIIYQKRVLPRKGTDRMHLIMQKSNQHRGDMERIRRVKDSRKA